MIQRKINAIVQNHNVSKNTVNVTQMEFIVMIVIVLIVIIIQVMQVLLIKN